MVAVALRWIAGELKKSQGASAIKKEETADELAKRLRRGKSIRRHVSLQLANGAELTRLVQPEALLAASARLSGARPDVPMSLQLELLEDETIRVGIAMVLWNRR